VPDRSTEGSLTAGGNFVASAAACTRYDQMADIASINDKKVKTIFLMLTT
jgi:hypothetical protein